MQDMNASTPEPRRTVFSAVPTDQMGDLLAAAHSDLDRVFAWLDGASVPGGPVRLVGRARARLAEACACLKLLREAAGAPPRGGA